MAMWETAAQRLGDGHPVGKADLPVWHLRCSSLIAGGMIVRDLKRACASGYHWHMATLQRYSRYQRKN